MLVCVSVCVCVCVRERERERERECSAMSVYVHRCVPVHIALGVYQGMHGLCV